MSEEPNNHHPGAHRAPPVSRRVLLAVAQRLLLGLAPALLAVVVVVALAYYGEVGREAPEYVVSGAAVLAIISMVLTWRNTRYLVDRLHRLGRLDDAVGGDDLTSPMDDLDRIEREVVRLREALELATAQARNERARYDRLLHEQATLLAATIRGTTAQLDEVRLPLHILLDARFGALNENQEELLVTARVGTEALDAAIRRLSTVADADRGALSLHLEPIAINDIVRAILPMARASAERRGVGITTELEPALPRAWADRAALAEALAMLATGLVESLDPPSPIAVRTHHTPSHCLIRLEPSTDSSTDPANHPAVLIDTVAARLLQAQQIEVSLHEGGVELRIPRFSVTGH